jgi:hypothetical protein
LLAERQVFEDKIVARAEEDDDPTDQVPEEGAHGPRILALSLKWKTWKSFVSRLLEVLRRQSNYISEERHFGSDYVLIVFYGFCTRIWKNMRFTRVWQFCPI